MCEGQNDDTGKRSAVETLRIKKTKVDILFTNILVGACFCVVLLGL